MASAPRHRVFLLISPAPSTRIRPDWLPARTCLARRIFAGNLAASGIDVGCSARVSRRDDTSFPRRSLRPEGVVSESACMCRADALFFYLARRRAAVEMTSSYFALRICHGDRWNVLWPRVVVTRASCPRIPKSCWRESDDGVRMPSSVPS